MIILIFSINKFLMRPALMSETSTREQISEEANRIASACLNNEKQGCYENHLTQLIQKKDIFYAEQLLNALQEIDPNMRSCHGLAHQLAGVAVRQDPSKWKDLLSKVNPTTCGGGFLHGIIETHTGDDPDFTFDSKTVQGTCQATAPQWSTQCIHTFGHIALLQTEGDVSKALPICDSLPKDLSSNCFNGLFMEDSFKTNLVEHGFVENLPSPTKDQKRFDQTYSRCSKYDGPAGIGCWADLGPIFVEFYKYDYQNVYNACQRANEEAERRHCYFRAVASIVISPQIDTTDDLLAICSPYFAQDKNAYRKCIIYLSASLVYNSTKFIQRANMFCSALSSEFQEDCFKGVGEILKDSIVSISERETLCREVEDKFESVCVEGNKDKSTKFYPFSVF